MAMKPQNPQGIISSLQRRIPLTLKMVILTFVIGSVGWIVIDNIQTENLRNIFRTQLTDSLKKQALDNRLAFDNYINAFHKSIRIIVTQKKFGDYIDNINWSHGINSPVKYYKNIPPWFPERSILRTLSQPRYVVLTDPSGKVREVYSDRREALPAFLLKPSLLLIRKSYNRSYMTIIDKTPYILTAESYVNTGTQLKATLLMASTIDDEFLNKSLGALSRDHLVALLTTGEDSHVLTSNNLEELLLGIKLTELQNKYFVTGNEFSDYDASEMQLKFASFIPMERVNILSESFISRSRQERAVSAFIFILIISSIVYWITRNLQRLNRNINSFSRNILGTKLQEQQKGDQLQILEERFYDLTAEVIKSREVIKKQAEEHTRFIVNNSFDAIITTNRDGVIKSWNPMAEKIFGWTAEEVTGKTVYDFVAPPDYHDLCLNSFKSFTPVGKWRLPGKQIVITACRRNGREFSAEVSFSPAEYERELMMILTVRDITKRQHAEKKIKALLRSIRKAKIEWESTFDNVGALIMLADKEHRIIRCNKSFADFAGLSASELIGTKCYEYLPCKSEWFSFKGRPNSREQTLKTEVSTEAGYWLYVNYLPIYDDNNCFLYTIVIATDITELKDTQHILMGSRKELKKRVEELENFYEIAVNRELKMKDLKKEIAVLKAKIENNNVIEVSNQPASTYKI